MAIKNSEIYHHHCSLLILPRRQSLGWIMPRTGPIINVQQPVVKLKFQNKF